MTLDPLLNAAIWTPGDVAKAAGLTYPKVKRLIQQGVLRPKRGGGGPGRFYTFTIADAIAASVWAIYRDSHLPNRWADGAARAVARLTAEQITRACEEGLIGIVPTNKTLIAWTLEPIADDLPPAQLSLCRELSLKTAVERTNRGIKKMIESRVVGRIGRQTGLESTVLSE